MSEIIPLGAHLVSERGIYTHHGIYVGNREVIHYEGLADGIQSGPVIISSVESFARARGYSIRDYEDRVYSDLEVIERARSRLGENDYNVLFNNCEHFCVWCITGEHVSEQVEKGKRFVVAALAHSVTKKIVEKSSVAVAAKVGEAARVLPKAAPVVAVTVGVAESCRWMSLYLKGDISKERLFHEIGETAVEHSAMFYYGMWGATLGSSIPLIGTALGAVGGSVVGYFVGSMLSKSGLIALGECDVVRSARERREFIEDICTQSIEESKVCRATLEGVLIEHFSDRMSFLNASFLEIDRALEEWNSDDTLMMLKEVSQAFGGKIMMNDDVELSSFDSFDSAMRNKDFRFVL